MAVAVCHLSPRVADRRPQSQTLEHYTRFSRHSPEFAEVVRLVHEVHCGQAGSAQQDAVHDKYAQSKYEQVSVTVRPARALPL